jgi:hypothetical protein
VKTRESEAFSKLETESTARTGRGDVIRCQLRIKTPPGLALRQDPGTPRVSS